MKGFLMKLVIKISMLIFLPAAILAMQTNQNFQESNKTREVISLIDAFMHGKIKASENEITFLDYENSSIAYKNSIKEAHDVLKELHNTILWLRLGWQATPLELELSNIHRTEPCFEKRKKCLISRLSQLSEDDKSQLILDDLHQFMNNHDLDDKLDNYEEIVSNRLALKHALMAASASEINDACSKPLHGPNSLRFNERLSKIIEDLKKLTENDAQKNEEVETEKLCAIS